MKPQKLPRYSGSGNSTPDRITEYRFNPKDQYKGEPCISITKSIQMTYQPKYNKETLFRVSKGHWSAFSKWMKEEVITPGKTNSSPLSLPSPNGVVTFSFNKDEEYKGSRFICIKKKAGAGRSTYDNLAIAKDDWPTFRKWMEQVVEEKMDDKGDCDHDRP
jgi:hypothetical protein